ncbi:MAG: ABC transporter ATP-binding protein [Phycisphaerae bacterium]|nr:ABC transporter ATP-binding protein [Phycisphaerae bacterium]MCZ2400297.1 ABC transporter ATP-binding protein [Phycisphaerae bacterium]NUQ50082.1 ABC transporter ATP-binding protein [Phycisphaerae bacterium]
MALLHLSGLMKSYASPDEPARTLVVDVPSFELHAGQQLALHGPSGSGKTTLLNLVAGILRADAGEIWLAGHNLTAVGESRRDRLRSELIGYIFQTFNLLQGYTALENVELAMRFGRGHDAAFAKHLLERVGLASRMNHRPRQLSAGQQQRVAVARALANHPRLILADEPTGNLDPAHAAAAIDLIRQVCREQGAALLLVSHDPTVLARFEEVVHLGAINRAAA